MIRIITINIRLNTISVIARFSSTKAVVRAIYRSMTALTVGRITSINGTSIIIITIYSSRDTVSANADVISTLIIIVTNHVSVRAGIIRGIATVNGTIIIIITIYGSVDTTICIIAGCSVTRRGSADYRGIRTTGGGTAAVRSTTVIIITINCNIST